MSLQLDDPGEEDRNGRGDTQQTHTWTLPGCEQFTVLIEQNAHGALTIRDPETYATYHVVSYASPRHRRRAEQLRRGTTVECCLSRIGHRANAWHVEELFVPVE